jgi:hypothetical protein
MIKSGMKNTKDTKCPYCLRSRRHPLVKMTMDHIFSGKGYMKKTAPLLIKACAKCNTEKSTCESLVNAIIHLPTNGYNVDSNEFNRMMGIGHAKGGATTFNGKLAKKSLDLSRPIITSKGYGIGFRDTSWFDTIRKAIEYHAKALTMRETDQGATEVDINFWNPLACSNTHLTRIVSWNTKFPMPPVISRNVGDCIDYQLWISAGKVNGTIKYGEQIFATFEAKF